METGYPFVWSQIRDRWEMITNGSDTNGPTKMVCSTRQSKQVTAAQHAWSAYDLKLAYGMTKTKKPNS